MAGALFGMEIHLAGPSEFQPQERIQAFCKENGLPRTWHFSTDPMEAVAEADVVYTDVWVSMGCEEEEGDRLSKMRPYAVTADLLAKAKPGALFMHCMPTHPGLEVSQEVLDSPKSVIFDQAENRLHAQKAIVTLLAREASGS